mgnify:CR=1 FL=1
MATQTFNFPRREDYTRIAAAIESQNQLLGNHFKAAGEPVARTWEGFRNLCRTGGVRAYYAVGDQLQCKKGDTTLTWDIVHIGDVKETGGNYVILQTHDCLPMDTMEFDSREAIFRAKSDLPAGTYHFTTQTTGITDTSWTDPQKSGWSKSWQFTTTKVVPAGGQICFAKGMDIGTDLPTLGIATYSKPTDTTALETVTLAEGTDGTDLATLGTINHAQRICYGYNRWSQSGLRQWLNSKAGAGAWWSPRNDFDRPEHYATWAGFMNDLDADFLDVVAKSNIVTDINKISDAGGHDTTQDYFFLPAMVNLNGGDNFYDIPGTTVQDIEDTVVWDYYTKFRRDGKTGTDAEQDDNRRKYKQGSSTEWSWWERSPCCANAYRARNSGGGGRVWGDFYVCNWVGVAPACRIE